MIILKDCQLQSFSDISASFVNADSHYVRGEMVKANYNTVLRDTP